MIRTLIRALVMGIVSDIDGLRWYRVNNLDIGTFSVVIEGADSR